MDYVKNPKEIEDKSMQIIYDYVKDLGLTDDEVRVVSRTVHASGDVEYAKLVKMSPDAVQKGIEALENGANIYTDVEWFAQVSPNQLLKFAVMKYIA